MKIDLIQTARLKLRPVRPEDLPWLSKLWSSPEVRKHLGGPLEEKVAESKAQELIGKTGFFVVTQKLDGKILGLCSLDTYRTGDKEVSCEFFQEYWGRGFAQEAVSNLIKWGFGNLDVPRIIAGTQLNNVKSRLLLERIGMTIVEEFIEFNEPQVMYALKKGSETI